jgi:hypothetical protein
LSGEVRLRSRRQGWYSSRQDDPDPFQGSATEIARRLGVSRRTVFNRRNESRIRS